MQNSSSWTKKILLFAAILMVLGLGYFTWYLYQANVSLEKDKASLESELKTATTTIARMNSQYNGLTNALTSAQTKANTYSSALDNANNTVDTLTRLAQTDPQLLYKYSKIFFLNENYTPAALTDIDTKYLYNKAKPLQFEDSAWPFLRNLLNAAAQNNVDLEVISAYRSFGTQALLKSSYDEVYGAGTANAFSADQGYSEHQLGTAVDFTDQKVGSTFSGFDKSDAYAWLTANAYKYGFILSYPPHNSYYIFEPWHWRFVGLDLALYLHQTDTYFYDMDQRNINAYLVDLFNGTTTATTTLP